MLNKEAIVEEISNVLEKVKNGDIADSTYYADNISGHIVSLSSYGSQMNSASVLNGYTIIANEAEDFLVKLIHEFVSFLERFRGEMNKEELYQKLTNIYEEIINIGN